MPDPPVHGARVLIIDDDESLGTAFKRYLGRRHEVVVVTSGAAALELFDAGEQFTVVLCDLTMPAQSGIELYELLREKYPEHAEHVVFMTGGDYSSSVKEFCDEVPARCLEKPVELEKLEAIVTLALSEGLPRRAGEGK